MTFSHCISTVMLSCCLTDQVTVVTTAQEVQFVYDGVSIQCTVLSCFQEPLLIVIVSCIFASILDFAEFVHFILVSDHALLHSYPTTDNSTSLVMICVTLYMARSATNRQGISHCL